MTHFIVSLTLVRFSSRRIRNKLCIFREFNKLILPGIKFSVLIRNMAPPQGEWGGGGGGGGGGAFAPNAPSWIRHCLLDPYNYDEASNMSN